MKTIRICILTAIISMMAPISAHCDDYYYCLDSAVHVAISDQVIEVQFDTTSMPPPLETFQSTYPCLSTETPEYIGRGFWAIPLETSCSYSAAAAQISGDPVVNRVFPAYRTASSEAGFQITDEVSVRFKSDLSADSALAILDAEGLQFVDSSIYTHNLWYCALAESIKTSPLDYGNRMHERSETEWACASQYVKPEIFSSPPDTYFANQYYLKNTGQNGGTPGADIDAARAWDIPLEDSTFIVAVIDEGVTTHIDLPSARVLLGWDFVGASANLEPLVPDDDPRPGTTNNHGMACAGILAAAHNDTGVVGVFGSCEIVPVKIFDDYGRASRSTRPIVDAIGYAQKRSARVVSCSWGYATTEPITAVQDAIRDAADGAGDGQMSPQATYGVVFVFAAGNYAENPHIPPFVHHIDSVTFPANMPEVIAVGAVDNQSQKWDYSCFGGALDVVAPSGYDGDSYGNVSQLSNQWTVDQEDMLGWNPLVTGGLPSETDDIDYSAVMGGTSGACPQVAGIAALLMARQHPSFNFTNPTPQIREVVTESAIDLGASGWDASTGYGRANAYRAMLSVIRGDVDNDGYITAQDLSLLTDMLFGGEHAVLDDRTGDLDCDGYPTALDMGILIDILFVGAPLPQPCFEY